MTLVVLDTNVLAPGFVRTARASVQLTDLSRAEVYDLVVSEHLLSEPARTFADPYFRSRLSDVEAQHILTLLRTDAILTPLTVTVTGVATQPEDDLVLATGLSAGAAYLARRDKQLSKLGSHRELIILHPADMLALLVV